MTTINLGFTELEIHEGYVVGRTAEGVHLDMEKHQMAMDAVCQYLSPPFGVLLDEKNSYSIDFKVMWHLRNDPSIAFFGVVYYRNSTKLALAIAKSIIKKPVLFSDNFEQVEDWMENQLPTAS